MAKDPLEHLKRQRQLRSQILTAIFASIFVYMIVGTGEALWQNYAINKEINHLKAEIAQLTDEGHQLKYLIAYLGTESFKEREARRKLGYKKPGEQVLALPNSILEELTPGQANGEEDTEKKPELSNPQKWQEFIFG